MVIVKDDYLITARISVGEFFGVPNDDAFIELRELNTMAMAGFERDLKSQDNEQIIKAFVGILPNVIVDHNLMRDETNKLTAAEVAVIIERKLDLFLKVLEEYKDKVLFTQGKKSAGK